MSVSTRTALGGRAGTRASRWAAIVGLLASLLVTAQLVASPQASASLNDDYRQAVLADGPLSYWPLQETSGPTAYDAMGQSDGAYGNAGPALGQPGPWAGATSVYSPGFCGDVNISSGYDRFTTPRFSVETWFNTTSAPNAWPWAYMLFRLHNYGSQLTIDQNGKLGFWVYTSGYPTDGGVGVTSPAAVNDGNWHHVVVTQDGASLTMILDGLPVTQAAMNGTPYYGVDHTATIASDTPWPACGAPYVGSYSQFAIYDHALSVGAVRAHYAASGRTPPPLPLIGGPLDITQMGSPSNRVPVCACADPVTLPFGSFSHTWTDFAIPGRGEALNLSHTYSETLAATDGPLGYGWDFPYDARLSVDPGTQAATIAEGGGTTAAFDLQPGGGYLPSAPRTLASLAHNGDGTWTFVRQRTETLTFNSAGQLTQLTDRNGYHTNLAYDGNGHVATVTDPAGRALTFTWTGSHITAVADPSTPARTIGFSFDGAGNLTDYTDVAAGNWHYTYDAAHRMLTMRDPRQVNANPPVAVTNVYDTQGRVTSQTDQLNRATLFDYTTVPGSVIVTDPKGNKVLQQFSTDNTLTAITRGYTTSSAATWQYTYDPSTAQVETVTDPNLHVTRFAYDTNGNLTRSSDALGRPDMTAVFNQFNEPVTSTDRVGVTTTNVYDTSGNLTSTSTPLDANNTRTTVYHYDDPAHPGDVTSMVDPNQKTWQYHYTANGDRDSITDPLGNKTTTVFNTIGWPQSTVSPRGNVTGGNPALYTTTFDSYTAFGDLQHTTDPLGHTTARDYDANRNLVSSTDGDQHTTTFEYDAENQQTETHRPDTSILYTAYWPDGRMKSQTDGAGHTTNYDYDPQSRLSTVTDPLGNITTHVYDGAGNETGKQDPGGNCAATPKVGCTSMAYDADNEVTSIVYSDGVTPNVTSIGYDNNGRRTSAVDSSGTSSWVYDNLGRLTSSSTPVGGAVSYGYDLNGQVTSIGYPNNAGTVTRDYWDNGQLKTVTDWLGHATTFGYDEDSNLSSQVNPNSTTATNTFDTASRLMAISDAPTATPNSPYASFTYGRSNGNLLTSVTSTGVPTDNHNWGYNTLNQLTTDTANPFQFSYDPGDNLTKINASGSQQFNSANQLCWSGAGTGTCAAPPAGATTYQYDTRGNRTSQTGPNAATYTYDQANRLTSVSGPITGTLAAGDLHSLALKPDGTVWAWGENASGQLGINSTTDSKVPVQVNNLTNVIAVAGGISHSLALKSDGTVWAWGLNSSGQLGNNTITTSKIPVQVNNLTNVTAIAAGGSHNLALKSDGTVWAWGENGSGQLGINSTTDSKVAVQVNNLTGVTAIGAGDNHSLAVKSDGTVAAWGNNASGQLGNNSTTTSKIPVAVNNLTGVTAVAGGSLHSLALKSDGTVWAWGENASGQLGINSTTDSHVPVQVSNLASVTAMAAGTTHSLAVKSDGTEWVWGENGSGQLGNNSTTDSKVPIQVANLSGITAVAGGKSHTLQAKTDGTITAQGLNSSGQLGNNTTTTSKIPVAVTGLSILGTVVKGTYTYDTNGLRSSKTVGGVTETFSWDVSGALPLLLADGGTNYVYGPGGLPLEQIVDTTVLYYNHDQLGSTRVLANQAGAVVATYTYDDYGRLSASTGAATNPFGYAGQYTDPETGFQYLRARYYDSSNGQFLNRDPVAAVTRDPYGYALRNPTTEADPSGLCGEPPGFIGPVQPCGPGVVPYFLQARGVTLATATDCTFKQLNPKDRAVYEYVNYDRLVEEDKIPASAHVDNWLTWIGDNGTEVAKVVGKGAVGCATGLEYSAGPAAVVGAKTKSAWLSVGVLAIGCGAGAVANNVSPNDVKPFNPGG